MIDHHKIQNLHNNVSKTDATQWSLIMKIFTTLDSAWKGSSLVRYLSTLKPKLLKQSNMALLSQDSIPEYL